MPICCGKKDDGTPCGSPANVNNPNMLFTCCRFHQAQAICRTCTPAPTGVIPAKPAATDAPAVTGVKPAVTGVKPAVTGDPAPPLVIPAHTPLKKQEQNFEITPTNDPSKLSFLGKQWTSSVVSTSRFDSSKDSILNQQQKAYAETLDVKKQKKAACNVLIGNIDVYKEELEAYRMMVLEYMNTPGTTAYTDSTPLLKKISNVFPDPQNEDGGVGGFKLQLKSINDQVKVLRDNDKKLEYKFEVRTFAEQVGTMMQVANGVMTAVKNEFDKEKGAIVDKEKKRLAAEQKEKDAEAAKATDALRKQMEAEKAAEAKAADEAKAAAEAKAVAEARAAAEAKATAEAQAAAEAEQARLQMLKDQAAARTAKALGTLAPIQPAVKTKQQEEAELLEKFEAESRAANFLQFAQLYIDNVSTDSESASKFEKHLIFTKAHQPTANEVCKHKDTLANLIVQKFSADATINNLLIKMATTLDNVCSSVSSGGGNKYKHRSMKRAKRRISTRKLNNKQKNNKRLSTKIIRRLY